MKLSRCSIGFGVLALVAGGAVFSGCATYAPRGGIITVADVPPEPPKPAPYQIHVGDRLAVKFYRNPELDQEVIVRPDGRISLPFVDEVDAAGLTPADLDAELTRRYRGELAVPDVTVMVQEFGGQKIYIGGEVGTEGVIELAGGMTLYQAIQQAGGFLDTAHRRQVVLIRRGADGQRTGHSINLRPVEHGVSPNEDVPLAPFDIVYVPKSKIANVNLFIEQFFRQLLPINPETALFLL